MEKFGNVEGFAESYEKTFKVVPKSVTSVDMKNSIRFMHFLLVQMVVCGSVESKASIERRFGILRRKDKFKGVHTQKRGLGYIISVGKVRVFFSTVQFRAIHAKIYSSIVSGIECVRESIYNVCSIMTDGSNVIIVDSYVDDPNTAVRSADFSNADYKYTHAYLFASIVKCELKKTETPWNTYIKENSLLFGSFDLSFNLV